MRKKRKQDRMRRMLTVILPVILLIVALGAVMVWKVFVVEEVDVVGNEIYSDEQIETWALNDDYSWNTIYVFLKNKFKKPEPIPFVDSLNISVKSPKHIQIKVTEKGVLGYIYIPSLGENAYFDKEGFVVELSTNVLPDTMKISGLAVDNAVLYQKLDLNDESILRTLLSLTQLLKKYEQEPEIIYVQSNEILLSYGDIQVQVGTGSFLNEKIIRMNQILPQLAGKTGMLHLDTWNKENTDIYFKQNEHIEIPDDVQTVPAQEDTDTAETSEPDDETKPESESGESENTGESDSEDAGNADEPDTEDSGDNTGDDGT